MSVGTAQVLLAEALSHRYPGASGWAVWELSFTLAAGEALGIVGESGCGKSTLARMLSRVIRPTAGCLLLAGQDWASAQQLAPFYRQVQLIFQDPASALSPRRSIAQSLLEPLQARTRPHAMRRVHELLEQVGLESSLLPRYPHQLSGGQRQRVVIARALAVEPRVLIADEPLAALDVSVQAQILNLFAQLRAELGLAIVFISHDLAAVANLCSRVLVMQRGERVECGPSTQVFTQPQHPHTQELLRWAHDPLSGTVAEADTLLERNTESGD